MKRIILAIALSAIALPAAFAQGRSGKSAKATSQTTEHQTISVSPQGAATPVGAPPPATGAATTTSLKPENISFSSDHYDFGTVSEGSAAEHVFTFTNTGKEPIIIQRVQPSCGCTTPDWSKDPIAPGATGMIKASYGTQGRPGHFDKTMTVFSNAGNRTISFGGNVEKAPETSVPQNSSIMRN